GVGGDGGRGGWWAAGRAGEGTLMALAAGQPDECPAVPCGPESLAAILYTSGTTGRSKGAMLTSQNLASNARALIKTWHFTKADTLLHALPIFHTHGLFVASNVMLMSAGSMLFLPKFDPDEVFLLLPPSTSLP